MLSSLVLFVLSLFSGGLVILFVFVSLGSIFMKIPPSMSILLLVVVDFSIFIIEGLIRKDFPDAKTGVRVFFDPEERRRIGRN